MSRTNYLHSLHQNTINRLNINKFPIDPTKGTGSNRKIKYWKKRSVSGTETNSPLPPTEQKKSDGMSTTSFEATMKVQGLKGFFV